MARRMYNPGFDALSRANRLDREMAASDHKRQAALDILRKAAERKNSPDPAERAKSLSPEEMEYQRSVIDAENRKEESYVASQSAITSAASSIAAQNLQQIREKEQLATSGQMHGPVTFMVHMWGHARAACQRVKHNRIWGRDPENRYYGNTWFGAGPSRRLMENLARARAKIKGYGFGV